MRKFWITYAVQVYANDADEAWNEVAEDLADRINDDANVIDVNLVDVEEVDEN